MNSKSFLKIGGIILLVLGVVGFVWPAPQLYPTFYLDSVENWAHLILGLVALAAASWLTDRTARKWLVAIVGIAALYFSVVGFMSGDVPMPNYAGVTNFETLDNLVHLVVGVWALWAAFLGKE